MKRSQKLSVAAALALTASVAKAQTLVYSFETLYNNSNVPDPAGTHPDDFKPNLLFGGSAVTQSTVGVTNGNFSMEFQQPAGNTFDGALTTVIPAIIDDPNTIALSLDVTIPSTANFTGAGFANLGILEYGNNATFGQNQVETSRMPVDQEVNIDLAPGTYHLTIPLIADANPITGQMNVPFSNCFGPDPNTQLTPTGFEFYFNKSPTSQLTAYLDNVTAIGPATNATWAHATGGSWSTLGDWSGGIPQLALDTANLTSAIGANSTITLDGNRSVQALNISNSSHNYTISAGSGGTLTLDAGGHNTSTITNSGGAHVISAPVDFNTNTMITVNNSGDMLTLSGAITGIGSLTTGGSGTVDVSGSNSYVGGTTVSSGTLLVGSAQSLPALNSVVNIDAGAKMQFATGIGGVTLQSITIASGGTLDIGNNHLFISYGTSADPISTIVSDLVSGYAGGTWTGAGITSSAAAATSGSYGVGYADSADPGNPAGLPSGTIEIAYTLLGDADLNGTVNGIDFGILAANFNKGVSRWDQGDFNYDNIVNGVDFGSLAANFNKGASGASAVAALDAFAAANGLLADVPEPATLGLLAIVAASTLSRRRRRMV